MLAAHEGYRSSIALGPIPKHPNCHLNVLGSDPSWTTRMLFSLSRWSL
ncbi:MAG: hypothetical protein U0165_02325 [Polyangiaceae bacterium]